jgi:hypothetical protein
MMHRLNNFLNSIQQAAEELKTMDFDADFDRDVKEIEMQLWELIEHLKELAKEK